MQQVYYEDVTVDTVIPQLIKHPTRRQLVMWAGASREFSEMHYDDAFAQAHGFPGVIVFGMLNNSFLAQMITDWAGEGATIRKLKTSNRKFVLVDKDVICSGKVTAKYEENGRNFVTCDVKVSCDDEDCVFGQFVVELPKRG